MLRLFLAFIGCPILYWRGFFILLTIIMSNMIIFDFLQCSFCVCWRLIMCLKVGSIFRFKISELALGSNTMNIFGSSMHIEYP